jgi:hypothetical protein
MSAASDEPSGPPPTSDSPRLEALVDRVAAISGRLTGVWRALPGERRLAGAAAVGLFVSLFLPWYQETVIARGVSSLRSLSDSLTGWGAFSFVEAAVLLLAAGVLLLLFVRAEGQPFHVPGGDGTVITAAGAWACVLIVWRMFDKEGTTGHGLYSTSAGIEWGIFVALAVAAVLTYAGTRIRLAHESEPPLPGERPGRRVRRRRGAAPRVGSRPRTEGARDWVAQDDIEETWLELERDMPRRPPAPPRTDPDATAPLAGTDPDATAPLPPASAAPAPRRRRPRSIAEPTTPSGDDQSTAWLDRRN